MQSRVSFVNLGFALPTQVKLSVSYLIRLENALQASAFNAHKEFIQAGRKINGDGPFRGFIVSSEQFPSEELS